MPDIIDFELKKDRRIEAGIEADQAHWDSVRGQLAAIMEISLLGDTALVSASLRALMDTLEPDMSRHDAKALIARCLKAFGVTDGPNQAA